MGLSRETALEFLREQIEESCSVKRDFSVELLGKIWCLAGRSRNVLPGVESARTARCYTVALTGQTGGDLARHVDLLLAVPSESTQRIQEASQPDRLYVLRSSGTRVS